jgi:hypothetical protein
LHNLDIIVITTKTHGIGSILGGIAFFVGISYSELTGAAMTAKVESKSFVNAMVILVCLILASIASFRLQFAVA